MNTPKQNKIGFWVIAIVVAVIYLAAVMEIIFKAKY